MASQCPYTRLPLVPMDPTDVPETLLEGIEP